MILHCAHKFSECKRFPSIVWPIMLAYMMQLYFGVDKGLDKKNNQGKIVNIFLPMLLKRTVSLRQFF